LWVKGTLNIFTHKLISLIPKKTENLKILSLQIMYKFGSTFCGAQNILTHKLKSEKMGHIFKLKKKYLNVCFTPFR